MDGRRIDALARRLASRSSRRRVVAAGGAAAGLAALAGVPGIEAVRACRPRGGRCSDSQQCCGYPDTERCNEAKKRCVRCRRPGEAVPGDDFSCQAELCCSFACRPTQTGGICADI